MEHPYSSPNTQLTPETPLKMIEVMKESRAMTEVMKELEQDNHNTLEEDLLVVQRRAREHGSPS